MTPLWLFAIPPAVLGAVMLGLMVLCAFPHRYGQRWDND